MASFIYRRAVLLCVALVLLLTLLISMAAAQSLTSPTAQGASPFSSLAGAAPPHLIAPSNPLGQPGSAYGQNGSDIIPLSSGMLGAYLPRIPNLELGFLYYFGQNLRTGRLSADYVLPFNLGPDSVLFGEAHGQTWDFWKNPGVSIVAPQSYTVTTSPASNRVDLSFGGGYRTMLGSNALIGVNGFYDSSRLFNRWYASGGLGLEMAANVAGDDALDLTFNWYGNLFNRDVLFNAFRNYGHSYDLEAGYSHALFDHSLDLRLKLIGYQFDIGTAVNGWLGGADLTTRDGMFTLRCEYGNDRIDGSYGDVGGFVNVGFQVENLIKGESPITMPEPVFKSPRNLRRLLGLKVRRNWYQPAAVVMARQSPTPSNHPEGDYIIISNTLYQDTYYYTDPVFNFANTPTSVTIYWSGYIGPPTTLLFGFRTPNGGYLPASDLQLIAINNFTGSQTIQLQFHPASQLKPGPENSFAFIFDPLGSGNLSFTNGGGLGFTFQYSPGPG